MFMGHVASLVFDPDAVRAMRAAYAEMCLLLDVPEGDEPLNRFLAAKVIEMATLGERDPLELRQQVLDVLGIASAVFE